MCQTTLPCFIQFLGYSNASLWSYLKWKWIWGFSNMLPRNHAAVLLAVQFGIEIKLSTETNDVTELNAAHVNLVIWKSEYLSHRSLSPP